MRFCLACLVFLLSFLGLMLVGVPGFASHSDTTELRAQVEKDLASFHLEAALKNAEKLENKAYRNFYQATAIFYQYVASLDQQYVLAFRDNWVQYEEALDEMPDTDPLKEVMIAELNCKRAGLEFLDGNNLTAIRYAQACRNHIRRNEKAFPDNIEQRKTLGLFNVVFGAVPRKYQWIANMLGYRGDIDTGLRQLEEAAQKGKLLNLESELIIFYMEKGMLSRQKEAVDRMERVRKATGPNMLLDYSLAAGYLNLKQNDKALEVLTYREQYAGNPKVFFIPFWDYLMGRAYYFKADYQRAQVYFSRFLKANKGSLFRTDATFRLGMTLTLGGNYTLGKNFFRQLSQDKTSGFDEDEYAEYMAKQYAIAEPTTTVQALFRARNYFDGGYFEQATGILSKLEPGEPQMNDAEKTELHYRYARVLHGQGKLDQAVAQYQQCITQPETDQLWLQVYAHFYQGEIFRGRGEKELARELYKKALGFNKYFYQAGLENRCKAALSELRKD